MASEHETAEQFDAAMQEGTAKDLDHKARRFMQIAKLERELTLKSGEVRDAKAHVKELEKEYDGILSEIRTAARDEGDLPLLDLMGSAVGKVS